MSVKAYNEAIARKRAAERDARPVDPAGYLKQLLFWAAEFQRPEPVIRRDAAFRSYAFRIEYQTSTPQSLRDEYIQKLREQCDSIAALNSSPAQ